MPLEAAYAAADRLSLQLAVVFGAMLVLLCGVLFFLNNRWIIAPLDPIGRQAQQISSDPGHLGEQIDMPRGREMAQLADAFSKMSIKLLAERHLLEQRVSERTGELKTANERIEHEISGHRGTIARLEETLKEVKQLRGILPISSYCKKIRDDAGYWNQLEKYLLDHSDARFSHGIRPDCEKEHFPDLDPSGDGEDKSGLPFSCKVAV